MTRLLMTALALTIAGGCLAQPVVEPGRFVISVGVGDLRQYQERLVARILLAEHLERLSGVALEAGRVVRDREAVERVEPALVLVAAE